MLSQITLIALATSALALQITSPTKHELWDLTKSQTIKWNSVNTDPSSFDIYLSHMNTQPSTNTLLVPNISKDVGTFTVSGLQLPLGDTYQINFVAHDKPEQIYAQSQQFNITGEAVAATSTLDGYTGPTYTSTGSAAASTATDSGATSATTSLTGSVTRTTLRTLTTTSGSATIVSTETGTTTEAASAAQTESATRSASGSATTSATRNGAAATGAPVAALIFGAAAFFL